MFRLRKFAFTITAFVVLGLGGLVMPQTASGQSYTITDIGRPVGVNNIFPLAINRTGQAIGYFDYDTSSSTPDCRGFINRAFFFSNNVLITLDTLPGAIGQLGCPPSNVALGINSAGQVVGYSDAADGTHHAFIYRTGFVQDLNSLITDGSGFTMLEAHAINDIGQIVGRGMRTDHKQRSFFFDLSTGKVTDIGDLFGGGLRPRALNSSGLVVGSFEAHCCGAGEHAEAGTWLSGVLTDIGIDQDSAAVAINDSGQIAGWSHVTAGAYHAFLWNKGARTDLGSLLPSGTQSFAVSLNSSGQVLGGDSRFATGVQHPWIWDSFKGFRDVAGLIAADSCYQVRFASAINAEGQILAYASRSDGLHAIILTPPTLPKPYTITDLGTAPGSLDSTAKAINSAGQVVGSSEFNSPGGHSYNRAFLYSGGTFTALLLPGAVSTDPRSQPTSSGSDINSFGQVVGTSDSSASRSHGFTYDKTNGIRDLNSLIPAGSGWVIESAESVDDNGRIVGMGVFAGKRLAYLYSKGTIISLGALTDPADSSGSSGPTAINSFGQVVGNSDSCAGPSCSFVHPFLYSGGVIMDLHKSFSFKPDFNTSSATGINDSGQIIGSAPNPKSPGLRWGFVYVGGVRTDLKLGGSSIQSSEASGINSSGQVVGASDYSAVSGRHGFIYDSTWGILDVNSLIPAGSGCEVILTNDISDKGLIVGRGRCAGQFKMILLTPAVP